MKKENTNYTLAFYKSQSYCNSHQVNQLSNDNRLCNICLATCHNTCLATCYLPANMSQYPPGNVAVPAWQRVKSSPSSDINELAWHWAKSPLPQTLLDLPGTGPSHPFLRRWTYLALGQATPSSDIIGLAQATLSSDITELAWHWAKPPLPQTEKRGLVWWHTLPICRSIWRDPKLSDYFLMALTPRTTPHSLLRDTRPPGPSRTF